ncbi:MAG: rRNA maturation RNase YbeY [Gammaproteobacteria bacterium]|nr:rRNA maturation RNase YbeY [Gammaproteobacteria bacterium]
MTIDIDIQNATEADGVPEEEEFQRWVEVALKGRRKKAELTIRLVDEPESRQLNREFRGPDRATNVLSFPFDAPAVVDLDLLGDIVICAPVVQHEAKQQAKPVTAHWAHMVVHGTLHLLGMDHQTDKEALQMEAAEVSILTNLGFQDPYVDDNRL